MDEYTIVLSKGAQKQLDKLPEKVVLPILNTIGMLASDPYPSGCKKLKARQGFRLRIGNYRVIYEVFDRQLLIDIIAIGHRKGIYQ
jgi:mRNA interferase RelE/StbE